MCELMRAILSDYKRAAGAIALAQHSQGARPSCNRPFYHARRRLATALGIKENWGNGIPIAKKVPHTRRACPAPEIPMPRKAPCGRRYSHPRHVQ